MKQDTNVGKNQKLAEIFAKMNLGELPAISGHVNEVLNITLNKRASVSCVSAVILKDYSLTNKVLQVANSAYYIRGARVSTIERAVAALGLDVVRELAVSISLIEEFLKCGGEKDALSKQMAISLLSANLGKLLVQKYKIPISPEEAYICTLLHDLGRIIMTIYFPDVYRRIEAGTTSGSSEDAMCRLMFKQLTFREIGQEIARFWNFSDTIIACMDPNPPEVESSVDELHILQNLAVFSNLFIRDLCDKRPPHIMARRFKNLFPIKMLPTLEMCISLADTVGSVSGVIRYGLTKLKYRSKCIATAHKYEKKSPPCPNAA
ncbi:MAG: HDOD domain-containing protein [Desulfurivibrionaceae bacterium]